MAATAFDPYDPTDANAVFSKDVFTPEVLAGMIFENTRDKMAFLPLVKEDRSTLVNRPGNTVILPKFAQLPIMPEVKENEQTPILPISYTETSVALKEIGGTIQFSDSATEDTLKAVRDFYISELGTSGSQKLDTDLLTAATENSATSKALTQPLAKADTLDWNNIVDGLVQWGDNGWGAAQGLITTPEGYGSLAKNPDFMADARATGTRATNGFIGTVAGMPVFMTSALKTVTKGKVGAVVVREGALNLLWKRLPGIETERSGRYRGQDWTYSARYAAYRSNDKGVILFTNPGA